MIYHIVERQVLDNAQTAGTFMEPSLESEGFIHFSTQDQVASTALRHYQEKRDLVVFEIDEEDVKDQLRYETAKHGESYPHVYSAIPVKIIRRVFPIMKGMDGLFHWTLGDSTSQVNPK